MKKIVIALSMLALCAMVSRTSSAANAPVKIYIEVPGYMKNCTLELYSDTDSLECSVSTVKPERKAE